MTIRREAIIGEPEGGIVKCFSCVAHGRIFLELIDKPSHVENALMAIAMAHEVTTKGKHDILVQSRHNPKSE